MLAGFRSRWMMPASWAASIASATCLAMVSASRRVEWTLRQSIGERRALHEFEHQSMRRSRILESVDVTDVRWFREASTVASRRNRACRSGSLDTLSGRIFSATSRLSFASRPRYTSPIPPAPSGTDDLVGAKSGSGWKASRSWRDYDKAAKADNQYAMKKVLIGIAVLLAVVAGGLYFWAHAILASDTVRSAVESQLSAALGQPVRVGSMGATVFPRVTMTLNDVRIGESDPDHRPSPRRGHRVARPALAPHRTGLGHADRRARRAPLAGRWRRLTVRPHRRRRAARRSRSCRSMRFPSTMSRS